MDIEFGWYGGLIIGNETGGLGKMPGFYFQAGEQGLYPRYCMLEQ